MEYKLAKQLKKAGFPQENWEKWSREGNVPKYICPCPIHHKAGCKKEVLDPILEELIEECGKETLVLWQYNKNWFAGLRTIMNSKGKVLTDTHTLIIDYEDYEIGKSKDVAVAKLYLKLNKASSSNLAG